MTNRVANDGILGYSYQFLHTIKDIINSDDSSEFLLEGVEDLDVVGVDETQLIQYKYHKDRNLDNSLVAKPITLMYNHFLQHEQESFKYKLFIKGAKNNFERLASNFKTMFELKESKKYQITKKNSEGKTVLDNNYQKFYRDNDKLELFIKKFELKEVPDFKTLEKEVIELIKNTLGISDEESEFQVYPLAYKWVNDKSRQKNESDRRTTKADFISKLISSKKQYDFSLIKRLHGEDEVVRKIKGELKSKNIKKNSADHIFVINNQNSYNTAQLITNLVRKFTYKGNKNDIRVPMFIINNNIFELKKQIVTLSKNENLTLVFNDGYEDYEFDKGIFNRKYFTIREGSTISKANYNLKILSKKTYIAQENNIELKNPAYFFIGESIEVENSSKVFLLNGLESDSILSIFK